MTAAAQAMLVPSPGTGTALPELHVLGNGHPCDSAVARVAALIDPGFLAEAGWDPVTRVLAPGADHRLLGWPVCREGCGNKVDAIAGTCQACRMRPRAGPPSPSRARSAPQGMEPAGCAVTGCERVTRSARQPLCESHRRHRGKLGLTLPQFLERPGVAGLRGFGSCQVAACSRQRSGSMSPYCEQHAVRLRGQRRAEPGLDEARWRQAEPAVGRDGMLSMAGLPDTLVVQVLLGLQQRTAHGSKTAITDLAQICDQGRRTKAATVAELAGPGTGNRAVLARTLAGYVHRALLDPQAEKVKDVWDLAAFGHGGHLDFTAISQGWLREAAKLWAAEDLARRRGRAGGTVQDRLKSLARFSESLRGGRADHGETPATLGRSDIDTFLQRLAFLAGAGELSQYARARTCRAVRSILGRIRAMGLTRPGRVAAGLPDDVTLTRCDVPAVPDEPEPGRDLPPEIMRQLCERLDQLGQRALTEFQVAAEIAIETGRRPDEICTLAWDCLHRDSDSNAVLVYDNHKSGRPGRRLPISANAAQLIIDQKQRVRARYPGAPLDRLVLLPSPKSNPDGCRPISAAGLGNAHREWIDAMPPLLLTDGTEFDKTRAVPYAYRHTYGTPTPGCPSTCCVT